MVKMHADCACGDGAERSVGCRVCSIPYLKKLEAREHGECPGWEFQSDPSVHSLLAFIDNTQSVSDRERICVR